jgi:hypothetical protein
MRQNLCVGNWQKQVGNCIILEMNRLYMDLNALSINIARLWELPYNNINSKSKIEKEGFYGF